MQCCPLRKRGLKERNRYIFKKNKKNDMIGLRFMVFLEAGSGIKEKEHERKDGKGKGMDKAE